MSSGRALTIWERSGTGAGVFAALVLGAGYGITRTTAAPLAATDVEYVRALLAERMKWEWVTFVGLLFLVLAVVDWYGTGTLGPLLVALALLWTATTSVVLIASKAAFERTAR
jgi:hypothetical protein